MSNTILKPDIDSGTVNASSLKPSKKSTILTPRFYTTDVEAIATIDLRLNQVEVEAICQEFRKDYNKRHFVRNEDFEGVADSLDPETRQVFMDFLEQSVISEFSGFLLYKELSRRIKNRNPLLAECFAHLARDEARHAGFLNKVMADFNLQLDLGFLTANKDYTYFQPKFIFYATYLSEKIGYWRYINVYEYLEKNPNKKLSPLFNYFKNWCQDENRHGDFFDALMRSQPYTLRGPISYLWCRFFLLAVFATMYLRDVANTDYYAALGLDPREYDKYVIKQTNASAARIFPVVLNVNDPNFYRRLERILNNNKILSRLDQDSSKLGFIMKLRKLPLWISNGAEMMKLFFSEPVSTATLCSSIH
uniref:Probable magnesium-protoporphyrin IX monomethyl ester [oxidative] cyclase n=1 Tax=Paulinella chromatophora TaxID=39717 RepID=B1X5N6_PAUCH|nr:Magnesium-protoporphyrin IX monomethyl ester aerobic oxidative cyclase [Paulinella chromatophora]ACB43255.1 Magnesium-protoporphyrin IX monomethyl ester aerobic oxidative cyclase [Paulinella chromatophora]